jgi:hypothetical protein
MSPLPQSLSAYSSEESELLMLVEEAGSIQVTYVRRPGSGRRKSRPFKAPWHHSESAAPSLAAAAVYRALAPTASSARFDADRGGPRALGCRPRRGLVHHNRDCPPRRNAPLTRGALAAAVCVAEPEEWIEEEIRPAPASQPALKWVPASSPPAMCP